MSHQDRPFPLVINHHTMKQGLDWLLTPAVFARLAGGSQATWKPRMLAAALWWATSDLSTLHERFTQARKIITKVFRWQRVPGGSDQGVMKMLAQWQDELRAAVVPPLRAQMQDVHQAQWETAGYAVFAGEAAGSRWLAAPPWKPPLRRSDGGLRRRTVGSLRARGGCRRNKRRLPGRRKRPLPSCG
jgi:hypothetical protein